jgi:DNA-binding SARP family transcriptional activator
MATGNGGLEVQLIGIPRVSWDGGELRLPSQKSLAIVCYLAVRRRPATRHELAELLWPAEGAANLRPELHRLRGLPGAEDWLDAGPNVAIAARTDLASFERAVREERYEAALELHAPTEELARGLAPRRAPAFEDWLDQERRRTQALYRDALRGQARALEEREAYAEALTCLRQLIELDPLEEGAYRAAMRCEYRRGHVDAALAQFEACRRVLAQELGVEPTGETVELARSIERGALSPAIGVPPRRMPLTLLRPPRLVGRERVWARLEAAWDAGQIINVSGAAGVGKTRLVMDFVRSKGSVFVLEGRPGDKVVPYSSLARALRAAIRDFPALLDRTPRWVRAEVGRILPDVVPDAPDTSASDPDGARFFEALIHLMGGLRRAVDAIVVDDLQDLDIRSFEVGLGAQARLLDAAGEAGDARMLAVFRSRELPAAFEQGLELAVRFGLAVHVELQPLDVDELGALLESLGVAETRNLAPALLRLTGGNPQLVVETLKRLHEVAGSFEPGGDPLGGPDTIASIFGRRLEGLGPFALRVVRAIAVLDQPAPAELLASVLDARPPDVVAALVDLERVQVLRGGSFVHDLLRESVHRQTPASARASLHRRVADALEGAGADPRRIAHHWKQAGEPARAHRHQVVAARRYQEAGLHADALELLVDVLGTNLVLSSPAGEGMAERLRDGLAQAQRALERHVASSRPTAADVGADRPAAGVGAESPRSEAEAEEPAA